MAEIEETTVGRLRRDLAGYPDDTVVTFGSTAAGVPLEFYRVKQRGPKLVQIELNEWHGPAPTSRR